MKLLEDTIQLKDSDKAEVQVAQLNNRAERIRNLGEEILAVIEDEDRQLEIEKQEQWEDEYIAITTKSTKFLQPAVAAPIRTTAPVQVQVAPTTTTFTRLPKLNFKKFKGESAQEWTPWWNNFDQAIHSNNAVSEQDKFNFLRAYIDYPAMATIEGYAPTSQNYQAAIAALHERYGRDDVLEAAHFNTLHNLPDASQKGDVKQLRKLYDVAAATIRSLAAMGVNANAYNRMGKPLLLCKLPNDMVIQWTKTANQATLPFSDLLDLSETS